MLVLTRACDEEIRIGDDIVVRVLDVKGERVRIGIQAPTSIPVHRQEVYLEIVRANREALQVAAAGLNEAKNLVEKTNQKDVPTEANPPGSEECEGTQRKWKVCTEVNHGT